MRKWRHNKPLYTHLRRKTCFTNLVRFSLIFVAQNVDSFIYLFLLPKFSDFIEMNLMHHYILANACSN
jgi:hypothetical protein